MGSQLTFGAAVAITAIAAVVGCLIGVFCSAEGGVCPLEQELLEKHRDANRFVDFSHRTIIHR